MKNNSERNIIHCSIRPFDCTYSNAIFVDDNIFENLCNLSETDCKHAILNIKKERKEKLNNIENEESKN